MKSFSNETLKTFDIFYHQYLDIFKFTFICNMCRITFTYFYFLYDCYINIIKFLNIF